METKDSSTQTATPLSTTGYGRFGLRYQQSIVNNLHVTPATARLVYGYMVAEHGTLDSLSPMDFDREALLMLAETETDPAMAERVAQSVGL